MQHEKLYNSHSKAILIVQFLFPKKVKLCVTSFRSCEPIIFFCTDVKFHFSYFIFLSPNIIFCMKKQNIPQDAA